MSIIGPPNKKLFSIQKTARCLSDLSLVLPKSADVGRNSIDNGGLHAYKRGQAKQTNEESQLPSSSLEGLHMSSRV